MDIPESMNLLPTNGLEVRFLGEIREEDLPELANRQKEGKKQLKRLRTVHHCAARMLAAGYRDVEVAARTGMHPNRIWMLKDDPAFQGLVQHYTEKEEEVWMDARRRAAQVGTLALEELQDRLMENPEDITVKQLMDIMEKGLSHGGFPATHRVESDSRMDILQEIKQESKEQGVVVNGEVERDPVGGREVEGGSGVEESEPIEAEAGRGEVREEGKKGPGEEISLDDLRPVGRISGGGKG